MSRQSKSGILKSDKKIKAYGYGVSVFVVTFLVTMLAASVFNAPGETSAESGDNTSSASVSGYNLSVSATSSVNLNLSVSDNDTMTISEGYVSVITNSPGYRLYISMTGDNTSLTGVKDGLSSTIAATSGTIAAPTSLTRGTWGYAIPSGTAHLVSNSFSSSYSPTTSTTPDSSKKFAVPPVASTNPALLASSTSSTAGDTYPVYYAVQANSDTAPGNYTNNIAFTAVADAGSVDKVTVTPSSSNVNASVTMSVDTTLYTTEGFAEANVYLLTATEYNSISGTNVEALGKTPLSCNRTNLAPLSYSCTFTAPSTQDRYYIYVKAPKYNKVYTTTFNTNNPVTLTVNPNGGTWEGSTSAQNFTQNEGTTKNIANPTAGPSYTISYNANGQGATYSGSPTSVQRPFTSWSKSGGGSFSNGTYTFGTSDGTLTATYNSTSNSFTLPAISKTGGYTCYWAEGSTSGTQYTGGTSRTITGNTTYYAVCKDMSKMCVDATIGSTFTHDGVNYIKLNTGSGTACYTTTSRGTATFTDAQSLCPTITAVPRLDDFSDLITAYGKNGLPNTWVDGNYWTSTSYPYNNQARYLVISSNGANISNAPQTQSFNVVCMHSSSLKFSNRDTSTNLAYYDLPIGESMNVTVTSPSGWYLKSVSCPSGYTCSGYTTGTSATGSQVVTITRTGGSAYGSTVSFVAEQNAQSYSTPSQGCSSVAVGKEFLVNGVRYIKLNTGSSSGVTDGTACYTKTSQGFTTFSNAPNQCPAGTRVPSQEDAVKLINSYGKKRGIV